jgi:hypothetical protein
MMFLNGVRKLNIKIIACVITVLSQCALKFPSHAALQDAAAVFADL